MRAPLVDIPWPIEPYPEYDAPATCDPTPKLGVEQFRDFVLAHWGGGSFGIPRKCSIGKPSHHHEGRAWDWAMDASSPVDAASVDDFFKWLFASDSFGNEAAALRRAEVILLIWDHQIWSPERGWHDYTGADPHTNHVHISFGHAGAAGNTSFFAWLHQLAGEKQAVTSIAPSGAAKAASSIFWLAAGVGASYGAFRLVFRGKRP